MFQYIQTLKYKIPWYIQIPKCTTTYKSLNVQLHTYKSLNVQIPKYKSPPLFTVWNIVHTYIYMDILIDKR